jgi:large subunit ribosomal protein L25
MDKIKLSAAKRAVLGKKVKALRRQGITPANIYGHGIESTAVEIGTLELKNTIAKAGKTGLISLTVKGEKSPRMVVIKGIQRHPLTQDLVHADLYQVKMKEKMKAEVPLVLIGEAPAVKELDGILLQSLNSIEVECLPGDIPHSIEIDLSVLDNIDQSIRVGDLKVPDGVGLLTDPERSVVTVTRRRIAEVVEEVAEAEEEVEAEEAKEEAEAEEAKEEAEEE